MAISPSTLSSSHKSSHCKTTDTENTKATLTQNNSSRFHMPRQLMSILRILSGQSRNSKTKLSTWNMTRLCTRLCMRMWVWSVSRENGIMKVVPSARKEEHRPIQPASIATLLLKNRYQGSSYQSKSPTTQAQSGQQLLINSLQQFSKVKTSTRWKITTKLDWEKRVRKESSRNSGSGLPQRRNRKGSNTQLWENHTKSMCKKLHLTIWDEFMIMNDQSVTLDKSWIINHYHRDWIDFICC